ncbi:MAG TPA: hypothetical protein VFY75_00340 [Solirubrobacterales bacterium]|nr:hypothetical protein [Solirubrobacterales bacterium]
MRSLLLFAPALGFGLAAVVASALALGGDRMENTDEAVARSRLVTWVALLATVLCALSLLVGCALLFLQTLPFGRD